MESQCPNEIEVDMGNEKTFVAGIEYPWLPKKCTKCNLFGQTTETSNLEGMQRNVSIRSWRMAFTRYSGLGQNLDQGILLYKN